MIQRRTETLFYTVAGLLSNDFRHAAAVKSDWHEARRAIAFLCIRRYPSDVLGQSKMRSSL
jgi:hypothetical protein